MKRTFIHGTPVTDQITGFEGIITGYSDYMTGCAQYLVQPKSDKTSQYPEARWFDEGRLLANIEKLKFDPKKVQAEKNGSDYSAPIK